MSLDCLLTNNQAMASLSYLQPYLDTIYAKAESVDVPTPVLDALVAQFHGMLYTYPISACRKKADSCLALNQPSSRHTSLRPTEIIHALSTPVPGFRRGTLFASREHQDAQELFQLITETLKEEALAVDKEANKDRGLSGLGPHRQVYLQRPAREPGKGVFEGLTANRRSCVMCGYTEAVMHFSFDNLQLTVPRMSQCRLEDCLEDYTRMEVLTDCICRKCSMTATLCKLEAEVIKLSVPTEGPETTSKKKRIRDAKQLVTRVKAALEEGRIEEDVKGVTMEKVVSRSSTKQAMLARVRPFVMNRVCRYLSNSQTPPVLALHLNRSAFYGHYASKNSCNVIYPEILDLTPFTTSGALSTVPQSPISKPAAALPPRSSTPTPSVYSAPRTLYRLASVVCHYGGHSFGHYVAYRRKPRDPALHTSRWSPPKLQCPYGCECDRCLELGPVRDANMFGEPTGSRKGKERTWESKDGGWLRISDDTVKEVGIDTVLGESTGSFMLYYEKVLPYHSDSMRTSARSSQETVTPHQEEKKVKLEEFIDEERLQSFNARIIRSVSVSTRSREGSMKAFGEKDAATPNGNSMMEDVQTSNGHADPDKSRSKEKDRMEVNGTAKPKLTNGSAHTTLSPKAHVMPMPPPSASPSRTTHHTPRSPSPVRAVDLMA